MKREQNMAISYETIKKNTTLADFVNSEESEDET